MSEITQHGSVVVEQQATVYKARNGRRYFSREAAYNKSANYLIKQHCKCSLGGISDGYYIDPCRLHDGEYSAKFKARLIRWLKWLDSRGES